MKIHRGVYFAEVACILESSIFYLVYMGRIITFSSGKGGTGKTTVVANLGTAFQQLRKRVAILDADITMANLELIIGIEGKPITLHDVLSGNESISKAIYKGPAGVRVVPAGVSFKGVKKSDIKKLREVAKNLAKKVDILLIDAASGFKSDSIIPMAVAHEVILVITPDILSISDALRTKMVARSLRKRVMGVIVDRVTHERGELSEKEIETVLELPILATIPEDLEVQRSAAFGEPVVTYKPNSPAAKAFKNLAADLMAKYP